MPSTVKEILLHQFNYRWSDEGVLGGSRPSAGDV